MYIQYTMDQLCLPMDLEEDIPENHLGRTPNDGAGKCIWTTEELPGFRRFLLRAWRK